MRTQCVRRMQFHRHPVTRQQCTTASTMNYSKTKFWIFWAFYIFNAASCEIILRVDPLALLSATLRTYQKAACDTDQVVIACPRGTSISIEFAQYNKFIAKDGISIDELCPATGGASDAIQTRAKAKHLLRGSIFGSPMQKVPANRYANGGYLLPTTMAAEVATSSSSAAVFESGTVVGSGTAAGVNGATRSTATVADNEDSTPENCMWPNALQYSLLQTVVEACQKKKHCKFSGSPHFYGMGASGVGDASGTSSYHSSTASSKAISVDPCPKRRKIVEVAYKCRPYEFRSKVACHNDVAQLECNPYSRIAVYSASFGRTEYESIQCPQPQGVREETCLASYATETVMQICHGRRRCNLAADANTFGSPCQPNSRMYLKVVYTCVPKQVLKDRYESDIESDEPEDFDGDLNDLYVDELNYKESEAIPKLYSNTTAPATRSNSIAVSAGASNSSSVTNSSIFETESTGVNPVMTHSADLSLNDDQERLYLYLLIAASVGVVFCIVAVAVRLTFQKQHGAGRNSHSSSSLKAVGGGIDGVETTVPHGFNDTISEIDADIDLTTPIPLPSVSQNENYIAYGPTTSLYGSLGPSNVSSHTSSTLLLQGSASNAVTPGLISNPLLCSGPRQSPDIIGISSNAFVATSSAASMLAPTIVFSGGSAVVSSSGVNSISSNNNSIGAPVPISSMAYTTAPTFRAGYIISPDGTLQRPLNTPTPPVVLTGGPPNVGYSSQQQTQSQQQSPVGSILLPSTSTLRRSKLSTTAASPPLLQQQPSYDGTAPRTLPTGLPANSQFYYG